MDVIQEYQLALRRIGILNFESFELSGEKRFLGRYLRNRPAAVVLDIGANAGDYSALVLEIEPSARIFAFEPHPATFTLLQRKLAGTSAKLFNCALGDAGGVAPLYDYRDADGSPHASLHRAVIEEIHSKPSVSHSVPVARLDDLVGELGLSHINLLKIDTEGHEMAVLKGAEATIGTKRVDAIQFEFNSLHIVTRTFFKDFWDLLSGYRFYRLLPNGVIQMQQYNPTLCEIFAFQNIVCVRNDLPEVM